MNSILERVNQVCKNVRDKSTESVNFRKLIALTRKEFRLNDIDLEIKTKKDQSLESDHFYVMAYYDAENDSENTTAIEVIIFHHFESNNEFKKHHTTELLIQIYDATVHELRHQQQSKKRKYITHNEHATEPYTSYLADPDELDAYAVSIAIELLRAMPAERAKKYMSKLTVLSKFKQNGSLVSPALRSYVGHFYKNPLLKKLSKKVFKNLDTVDTDQIFK